LFVAGAGTTSPGGNLILARCGAYNPHHAGHQQDGQPSQQNPQPVLHLARTG
jgi:hypothetical protein